MWPLLNPNKTRCILPRCAANDEASGLLSIAQVQDEKLLFLSCFELYNKKNSNARGQMQAMLKKLAGLLEPTNLANEIRLHMGKQRTAMDAVLASPGLTSMEDLAPHIEALNAVSFIHQAAHNNALDKELKLVYQRVEDKIVLLIKDLPGALTLTESMMGVKSLGLEKI